MVSSTFLVPFIFSLAIARFQSLPILPISVANTSSWALPNSLACGGSSGGTNYCGDIRARIELTNGDIISITENIDSNKYSIDNMYKNLSDYKASFNKEKFKNNSNSTAEAFEKFAYYKEKFYEIFD